MLFNSIEFALFLPLVFSIYWLIGRNNIKAQNGFLLLASYVFYGWWDWRFLSLVVFSSIVDFLIGRQMMKISGSRRKLLLLASLTVNLGLLGFFKYYNFFLESFADAFQLLGQELSTDRLNIILPVGISFYTFQTLSYSIDVYRKKITPIADPLAFFAFVSFFPQLVAGPIERAKNLLPQFQKARTFKYSRAVDGLRQILWGLFKKIVIADNCATIANDIFTNYENYGSFTLLLGALFFAFQIYGDFSGYSDIAIGTSRLFGFDLMRNFAYPYFSRSISEFWRRWHISLSTWFRDYLYIPLGGSKGPLKIKIRNVFAIFIISGFWHGANWTFIFWGFLNALYFLPGFILGRNRSFLDVVAEQRMFPSIRELIQILSTFLLTLVAWIAFRAENMGHAWNYYKSIFSLEKGMSDAQSFGAVPYFIILLVLVEWSERNNPHGLWLAERVKRPIVRWGLYFVIVGAIYMFGNFASAYEFIYFQF